VNQSKWQSAAHLGAAALAREIAAYAPHLAAPATPAAHRLHPSRRAHSSAASRASRRS